MYHKYRFQIYLLIILILFSLVAKSGTNVEIAQAQTDEDIFSLTDAESYAKHNEVGIEEALYRFDIQEAAGELEAKLTENESDAFAGLWLEHKPEFKIVVLFTQDANEKIEPYITDELTDIVEARTVEVSLIELENLQKELLSSLANLEIRFESEINVRENNVTLAIVEADKTKFDLALQAGLLQISIYVKVIYILELGKTESIIYGGLPLNPCTSAFSVQDNAIGLNRGITTAGHCSESYSLSYDGVDLPVQEWLKYGVYDVGFHISPNFTVTNQFQARSSETRRVSATKSRANQVIGGYVCKYGVTTEYTCGYISSKTVNGNVNPPLAATFIRVDNTAGYNDLSSGGDSGGPWFLSTTAYGIHHASSGIDPNDAIYMAINYIEGLDLSVVINPVFADVPWDYWAWQDIERLYNAGFTAGCSTNPRNYCPNNTLTRAEISVFLLRGIHGAYYTPPPVGSSTGFNDVPTTHWGAAWIKQFSLEGITAGCSTNPPLFCPEGITTNSQMAIFLLRSKYGGSYVPPDVGSSTGFNDVPTNYWAAAWIKQLGVEGITSGCGGGNYCPESYVSRSQMAGLLVRTFNLP